MKPARRPDRVVPITIQAAPFTYRTFHVDDWPSESEIYCPAHLVTISMPAIAGVRHRETPTWEVTL